MFLYVLSKTHISLLNLSKYLHVLYSKPICYVKYWGYLPDYCVDFHRGPPQDPLLSLGESPAKKVIYSVNTSEYIIYTVPYKHIMGNFE